MIDGKNKNEVIEQYLLGDLKGQMLEEFEHKLTTDDSFRREVALEQALVRQIKAVGRAEMLARFDAYHGKIEEEAEADAVASEKQVAQGAASGKVISLFTRQNLFIAASAVFLIACALLISALFWNRNTPEAVFAASFEPYPAMAVLRSSPALRDYRNEAAVAYNAGNYRQSIPLFKRHLELAKDEEAVFYLGNAYLAAEMPQEAITTLEAYLQEYREFEHEAKWYLSLSYILTERKEKARSLLQEIAAADSPNNPYREEAAKILRQYR